MGDMYAMPSSNGNSTLSNLHSPIGSSRPNVLFFKIYILQCYCKMLAPRNSSENANFEITGPTRISAKAGPIIRLRLHKLTYQFLAHVAQASIAMRFYC